MQELSELPLEEIKNVTRVSHSNLINRFAVALVQSPLQLRHQMVKSLLGGADQLQFVLNVSILWLGRQVIIQHFVQ